MFKPILGFGVILFFMSACSSGPDVRKQRYAELKSEQTFEYEFHEVWKAIEKATEKYKISDQDPEKGISPVELKQLTEGELETDWIIGKSRDKYIEYRVNGFPKKKYLQTRVKYEFEVRQVLGGTHVTVEMEEEVERLKQDGTSMGWSSIDSDKIDTSRTQEILQRIKLSLLGRRP